MTALILPFPNPTPSPVTSVEPVAVFTPDARRPARNITVGEQWAVYQALRDRLARNSLEDDKDFPAWNR